MKSIIKDKIVFSPEDVSKSIRPLSRDLSRKTKIIGTFNPAISRLSNGNVIMVVRVSEGLTNWIFKNKVLSPRFDYIKKKFVIDSYDRKDVIIDKKEPRFFFVKQKKNAKALRLTFISWLLPVELASDGMKVIKIHYNKIILPAKQINEMGVEDPRITLIDGIYYMTVVCVSSNKICTCLYKSKNGLKYGFIDIIFDHQNKNVVLFEKKINNKYYALTRPEGKDYLAQRANSKFQSGKFIGLCESLDLLYWKPHENVLIQTNKKGLITSKLGPGAPPIKYKFCGKEYFLELFHGVEDVKNNPIGRYRTFAVLLDIKNPSKIICISKGPILEYNKELKKQIKSNIFIKKDIVFTTGIVKSVESDTYIISSGELDTACRITIVNKKYFDSFFRV